jgi:uncharacterized protein (TIGR03083 family)
VIVEVERGQLASAIDSAVERIGAMIEARADMDRRLPGSKWTVGEAAAHIAVTQGVFAEIAGGGAHPYREASIERFAATNREGIDQVQDRSGTGLASVIRTQTQALLADLAEAPAQQVFDAPIGKLTTTQLASYCLSHLLMHGYPIALALQERPPLDASHVRLVMPFLEAAAPFSFSNLSGRRMDARVEFSVGDGTRFGMVITPETAAIVAPPLGRVDVHVYARSVPFLLVTLGLRSPWSVMARGGMIAWGRRPWLALQLKEALPNL